MTNNQQEEYWKNVLSNCFYLNYPGVDGTNKVYDPMRPLYPMLKELKRQGAVLAKTTKADRTEHYKLEQGTIETDKWNQIRTEQLFPQRDKLIWLFAVSVLGEATAEGVEQAERLFGEMMKKYPIETEAREVEANLFSEVR